MNFSNDISHIESIKNDYLIELFDSLTEDIFYLFEHFSLKRLKITFKSENHLQFNFVAFYSFN